jgi:hypothetical protein
MGCATRAPVTGKKDTLEVPRYQQDSVSRAQSFLRLIGETGKISICVRVDSSEYRHVVNSTTSSFLLPLMHDRTPVDIDPARDLAKCKLTAGASLTSLHRHGLPVQRIVECEPQNLTQASDALICIETNTTNVEIASIRQLIFNQGLAQNAVSDGAEMT